MILFNDWRISCAGNLLAMQYDNLSRQLQVKGSLPEGYDWAVLVQSGEWFDIIPMELQGDAGLTVNLTAQQLSQSGSYTLQLRGMKEEMVRHTNCITVFVGPSLSGDENWPEIPSEFTQLEQRVYGAVHSAERSQSSAAESAANAAVSAGQSDLAAANAANSEAAAQTAAGSAAANEKAAAASAAAAQGSAEEAKEAAEQAASFAPEGVDGTVGVELLAESGILTPAYEDGAFYADGDGVIYIL